VQNTIVFSTHTALAYFWLFTFYTALPAAILCGLYSIIKKSGLSPWWIVVPATPTLLTMLLVYLLFFVPVSIASGFGTISEPSTVNTWNSLSLVIVALDVLNIVAFFLFAFVQWPIEQEVARLRSSVRDARGAALLQYANAQPGLSRATMASTRVPSPAGAPEATRFYCSWCGKERSSDAYALHHCGARTRPPAFCSTCGQGLETGIGFCDRCGTAASTLSQP
jgi:hypothetical protein